MAMSNIGNLLQHFMAIHAADAIRKVYSGENSKVIYVDGFAMAPWEPIKNPKAPFGQILDSFGSRAANGDLVAATFQTAWAAHYGSRPAPDPATTRDYPNTAVLLQAAFPEVNWEMRLFDIDPDKQNALGAWAESHPQLSTTIGGNCFDGVLGHPVPADFPALLMLDPYRFLPESHPDKYKEGMLPENKLRGMLGKHSLDLLSRPSSPTALTALVLLFSYTESNPDATDRVVAEFFGKYGEWYIERVMVQAKGSRPNTFHQGWWICSDDKRLGGSGLQERWDQWWRSE